MTPCINVCQLHNDVCIGCNRTRQQIRDWRDLVSWEQKLIMLGLGYHICPYKVEFGDMDTLCNCDEHDARSCKDDI